MTASPPKPYKGIPMEGPIAAWYARNTRHDTRRFRSVAQSVAERVPEGARVLEVAPGPGYLAIEIAKAGRLVAALDISKSFVRMTRENAARAGVTVDVRQGSASAMPFPDQSFDFVVCMAAFKNFTDPVGALNEMHRVLAPGGEASIYDLRKDALLGEIDAEVGRMGLSKWNAVLTRWIFRHWLLKKAYTRRDLERMVSASRFQSGQIEPDGIGFELRLKK
jgi:ubiquinone/menaquinone biosynthesis C-methylase UbiE